jgi:MOSC domain-containing protein YiiM
MQWPVPYLAVGGIGALPEGRPTAIYKAPLPGPVVIGREGLAGDAQADRRVHGGPEKAVHLYPAGHYQRLAAAFPEAAATLLIGSLGENLSAPVDENQVCIGDIFAFGSARLQLSQPRSPCWKIDARHGQDGIAAFIAEQGLTGWYFRVLTPGTAAAGDQLRLQERNPDPISLAEFWRGSQEHRPSTVALQRWAATPGLTPAWRERLLARLAWLAAHQDPAPAKAWHPRPD